MKNIIFKFECDSGKFAGTGHLSRVLKLYNLIKKNYQNKLNYYFLFSNQKCSLEIVKKHIKKGILLYQEDHNNLNFLKNDDLIINDSPKKISKKFISFCEKKKIKDLILIDHDQINFKYNSYLINGIFSFKKKLIKKRTIYQGLKYLLLDEKFSKIKKKKSKSFNILITSGGTDNKNMLYKIYEIVKNLRNVSFFFIIGSGFKKTNPMLRVKRKNFFLIKNKRNLYPYFQKANLSITAGGISMFESLASKNITFVMQLYKNQTFAIKNLQKLNLIKIVANNSTVNKTKLLSLISNCQKTQEDQKLENYKYLKNLDGKAIYRIEKIIKKIINSKI